VDRTNRLTKAKAFDYFYTNPIISYIQNWGHIMTERLLPATGLILDIGAGTGEHQKFVGSDRRYIALDKDADVLQIARQLGRYQISLQSTAQFLPFASNSFEGLVSVFSLEHFRELDKCVAEFSRILKKNGVLAATIPTEGFAFRLGRRFVTAPFAVKNLGYKSVSDYEDYVRQEHINSVEQILTVIRRYFLIKYVRWFPFFIGGKTLNINLCFKAVRL